MRLATPTIPAKSGWDTWTVSPFPPTQCWKISRFFQEKGKNHLIINIESGGGENLFRAPTLLSGIVKSSQVRHLDWKQLVYQL